MKMASLAVLLLGSVCLVTAGWSLLEGEVSSAAMEGLLAGLLFYYGHRRWVMSRRGA